LVFCFSAELARSVIPSIVSLSYFGHLDYPYFFCAVHRAIALIIKLSGAGSYLEDNLRDLDEVNVGADGLTNLMPFLKLQLGGWLEMSVY
jgi:hypothetical protein